MPQNGKLYLHGTESHGADGRDLAPPHPVEPPPARPAGRARPPGFLEGLALIALLAVYGIFLILGTFVHTARLDKEFEGGAITPGNFVVMLTCWTWTNLLILCCVASVIGELGRRVLLGSREARQLRGAIIRGFLVLLLVMAGQFIVLGTPGAMAVPKPHIEESLRTHVCLQHFFRLAAFASLVSLLAALDPRLLKKVLDGFGNGHGEGKHGQPDAPASR